MTGASNVLRWNLLCKKANLGISQASKVSLYVLHSFYETHAWELCETARVLTSIASDISSFSSSAVTFAAFISTCGTLTLTGLGLTDRRSLSNTAKTL